MIYTGLCGGKKLEEVKRRGLGIMISSTERMPTSAIKGMPCALDNGAFSSYMKGKPFNEYRFLRTLDACQKHDLDLDFIVLPDIVEGGWKSINFSRSWLERIQCDHLALAVQDGVRSEWLHRELVHEVSTIFVGGSPLWKWKTAKMWVDFAHSRGKKCHIGQCGKLEYLRKAREYGADSCDSTSFVVNNSWHILDEFIEPKQRELIDG